MHLVLVTWNVVHIPPFALLVGQINRLGDPIDHITRFSRTTERTKRIEQQRNPFYEFSFALGS